MPSAEWERYGANITPNAKLSTPIPIQGIEAEFSIRMAEVFVPRGQTMEPFAHPTGLLGFVGKE